MGWGPREDKNRFRALSLLHELATPRLIKKNNQNEVVDLWFTLRSLVLALPSIVAHYEDTREKRK